MDSTDWVVLQTLYEQQNITKASEILFLSQPALSYRIQHLEKEFGVVILQRSRKGIEFTPQGEYLYKYAQEMLTRFHIVKDTLANMDQKVIGLLKIGAARSLTKNVLPDVLEQFSLRYPDVEFAINTGKSSDVLNMIRSHKIHVGFVRGDVKWEGEKKLVTAEGISIVSYKEISYSELPKLNMISYNTEGSLAKSISAWWKSMYQTHPNVIMSVDKTETALEMVKHGLGYAILPNLILRNAENLFLLPLKTENEELIVRNSWIIYQKEALSFPIVKAFVEHISEN